MGRQWVTRLLAALLRFALHRWPEALRDQAEREWRAEIAEIQSEPGVHGVVRDIRALRFAASLARSRVGADGEAWPDRVAAAGRASRPFLLLFALPTVSLVIWLALNAYDYFQSFIPGLYQYSEAGSVVSLLVLLVLVAGMGWAGWWLGRAMPVLWTGDQRLRSGLAAVAAPIVLMLGSVAMIPALVGGNGQAVVTWPVPAALAALLIWTAGLVVVLRWGRNKVLAGSRRLGLLIAAVGSLLVTWIAGTVALAQTAGPLGASLASVPLWLPAAFVPPWHAVIFPVFAAPVGVSNGVANWLPTFGSFFPAFLICAAFAVGYVLQQGMVESSPVAVKTTRPDPGVLRLPVVSRIAYGLVAVAVLIWADMLAVTNSSMAAMGAADGGDTPEEVHLWLQEVRQLAILVVGLGLLVALRRYRWAGASAAVVAVLLLGADLVIDRTNVEGWAGLVFAAALAAALVLAAGQACRRAGLTGADQANDPRRFSRIAMVAGFCAPMSLLNLNGALNASGPPFAVIPFDLVVGTYAVGLALVVLAASGALLARPSTTWTTLVVAAASIALYAGIIVLGRQRAMPVLVLAPLYSSLPIAVSFFGLARWTGWPSVRAVLGRLALLVAALVAAMPAIAVAAVVATFASSGLMAAAGYGFPSDGLPIASGAVAVSAGVAFLFTIRLRWRVRTRQPAVPIAGAEPA